MVYIGLSICLDQCFKLIKYILWRYMITDERRALNRRIHSATKDNDAQMCKPNDYKMR